MMSSSHGPGGSPTSGQANSPTTSVPQGIKANAFTAATVSVNSKYDHLKSKGFQADVIYPLPVYHEYCHGPSTSFADVHRPLLNQKTSDSLASSGQLSSKSASANAPTAPLLPYSTRTLSPSARPTSSPVS